MSTAADAIFNRKPKMTTVETDGLGTVQVRKLSQNEVESIRKNYTGTDEKNVAGIRYIVCRCVVDESTGHRIFDDKQLDKVGEIDFEDCKKIAEAVADFSGLKPDPKAQSVDSAATSTDLQS